MDKWWISGGFFHMKNKRKLCNKIIFFGSLRWWSAWYQDWVTNTRAICENTRRSLSWWCAVLRFCWEFQTWHRLVFPTIYWLVFAPARETYSESYQTLKMEGFAKIVNGWKLYLKCLTRVWIRFCTKALVRRCSFFKIKS